MHYSGCNESHIVDDVHEMKIPSVDELEKDGRVRTIHVIMS